MGTIYTGRGDRGKTDLFSGERVSKTDPRIEAYGTVDELNTVIGLAAGGAESRGREQLLRVLIGIQNRLHSICANLANTNTDAGAPEIQQTHVEELEDVIDGMEEELEPLTQFILPGGTSLAVRLHHARAVCRRAERRLVDAQERDEQDIHPENLRYLNRLSDLLFVMARVANHRAGREERNPSYD